MGGGFNVWSRVVLHIPRGEGWFCDGRWAGGRGLGPGRRKRSRVSCATEELSPFFERRAVADIHHRLGLGESRGLEKGGDRKR